jgi:uncharacterized membrane protein
MITVVQELTQFFEPWKSAFGDSKALSMTVTSLHIVGLLFGGGFAVAADRATLRLTRGRPDERAHLLSELHKTHGPVLIAIAVLFVTGTALAAADVESFIVSPIFWVKMVLILVLLANGAVLKSSSDRLRTNEAAESPAVAVLVRRLRRSAMFSIALWTTTLVLGTALSTYA